MRFAPTKDEPVAVDIAPLIDMVFLLLLFFMLTSSAVVQSSIRVSLPKAETGQTAASTTLVITLTKDHLLYFQDELISEKALEERLSQEGTQYPVLIRADRHAYVDRLMSLWDLCRKIGFQKVHIATLQES